MLPSDVPSRAPPRGPAPSVRHPRRSDPCRRQPIPAGRNRPGTARPAPSSPGEGGKSRGAAPERVRPRGGQEGPGRTLEAQRSGGESGRQQEEAKDARCSRSCSSCAGLGSAWARLSRSLRVGSAVTAGTGATRLRRIPVWHPRHDGWILIASSHPGGGVLGGAAFPPECPGGVVELGEDGLGEAGVPPGQLEQEPGAGSQSSGSAAGERSPRPAQPCPRMERPFPPDLKLALSLP